MSTTSQPLTLTENAVSKIKELIGQDDALKGEELAALRIYVQGGGCSGFQYALGFDTELHEDDIRIDQDGVTVLVDNVSVEYLSGSQVDFQDGLNGKGFAIENPNASGTCGCGQSFNC